MFSSTSDGLNLENTFLFAFSHLGATFCEALTQKGDKNTIIIIILIIIREEYSRPRSILSWVS